MIVVSRMGAGGATDATPANHYSLLQTVEQNRPSAPWSRAVPVGLVTRCRSAPSPSWL